PTLDTNARRVSMAASIADAPLDPRAPPSPRSVRAPHDRGPSRPARHPPPSRLPKHRGTTQSSGFQRSATAAPWRSEYGREFWGPHDEQSAISGPPQWSNKRALQHDAAVDRARRLRQKPGRDDRKLRAVRQLAEQVDQPAHRPDQIALVAAERGLHDAGPVVVARGPAIDRRHEPRLDADRHAEVPRPLGLEDGVGEADQVVELALELPLPLEERPGDHRLAGARLFEQRG